MCIRWQTQGLRQLVSQCNTGRLESQRLTLSDLTQCLKLSTVSTLAGVLMNSACAMFRVALKTIMLIHVFLH